MSFKKNSEFDLSLVGCENTNAEEGAIIYVHRVYRVQQLFRSTDEQRLRMIIVRLVYC